MRYSILAILFILFSCRKKEGYEHIAVIGHGGMGLEMQNSVYHDNSAEAFELALSIEGCDGVELDVQLSQDGELWLYHDTELSSETNGSGCVRGRASEDLGSYHYKTFQKEELITLDELGFELLKNKKVFLDIRHFDPCSEAFTDVTAMISAISNSGIQSVEGIELYVILSTVYWVSDFEQAGLKVLYCTSGGTDHISWFAAYPELDGVVAKNSEITKEQVEMLHSMDKKVFIFEMRSPKGIRRALAKLPDGVITDDIRATLIEKY